MSSIETSKLNYFTLLKLPVSAEPDRLAMDMAYQQLQGSWHPDKFAGEDASARLEAVQKTSLLNDAYNTLKHPVSRAAYLLQLRGIEPWQHVQGELPSAFLLEQIALRESLEDLVNAADEAGLAKLGDEASEAFDSYWAQFKSELDADTLPGAKAAFHKLQFIAKLQEEIYEEEARLFD